MFDNNEYPVLSYYIRVLQMHNLWSKTGNKCSRYFYYGLWIKYVLVTPLIFGMIWKKIQIYLGKQENFVRDDRYN